MITSLSRFVLSILIGAVGGYIFYILHFPLPWLLGALCSTLVASMAGAPIDVSNGIRNLVIVIIGLVLGSTFTPDILKHIPDWIPTLSAAVIYVAVVTFIAQLYCRKVAGMDAVTALFSGLPGGLSEMIILGEEAGADVKKITLAHAVRVVGVLLFIPFLLTYGFHLEQVVDTHVPQYWHLPDALLLVACGIVGMYGAKLIRLPAYRLTGPLILSSIVYLNGIIVTEPPEWASLIIQLILGSSIGSRFYGTTYKEIVTVVAHAFGMIVVMLAVTFASAYVIAYLTGFSYTALILALSPGGFAEMALAALSMGIDPAFVTTHHAMRLFAIVFVTPFIIKLIARRKK
ncbi:AbrB family transcriptional regulator [Terasakiella pusilla]|uniref:AbrB family transcriptional regulator n=1 Tax=Terasakiella pusilla TaxID=64973 RepID=UPI00048C5646|nr:AbrB family transcriptional regulator [Terasakiella pusilla]